MKANNYYSKNQIRLYDNNTNILQSYNSKVVEIKKGIITLGRDWDYSTTTSKYVYHFLDDFTKIDFYNVKNKKKFVNDLIKDGTIIYDERMF